MAQRPKALLAIAAVGVAAAAVVLVIAVKKGDGAPGAKSTDPANPTVAVGGSDSPPVSDPSRSGAPVVKPSEAGEVERVDRPEVKEYEVDGMKIRDHRRNPTEVKLPPNVHPPEARRVAVAIVNDLHRQVRAIAPECAKQVAAADRGSKPKLDMQIAIDIKDKQAKVTRSIAALTDISGASADALKTCLQDKTAGLVSAAPDEADIENYSINLSLPL